MTISPNNISKVITTTCVAVCVTLLFLDIAEAAQGTQDVNILSSITLKFQTTARQWGKALQVYALVLFRWLLIADVCLMGIRLALKRAELGEVLVEFIRLLLFASFMFTVIYYHKTWSNNIILGLGQIAETELSAPPMEPSAIFWAGLEVVGRIWEKISLFSNPVSSLGLVAFGIALTIVFALITAQVVLVKCEAYIVLNAGTILLGFGGSRLTKEYAINFIRYSLAIAVKLFVMQLLVSLSLSFTEDLSLAQVDYNELAVVLGASIVLLALTMTIPDICSGIINGSHVPTGQAITSAVSAVGIGTMAAMQAVKAGAASTPGAIQAVKEASGMANTDGATGMGKAAHMGKSLWGAHKANTDPSYGAKMASQLKSMREAMDMERDADGNGEE